MLLVSIEMQIKATERGPHTPTGIVKMGKGVCKWEAVGKHSMDIKWRIMAWEGKSVQW